MEGDSGPLYIMPSSRYDTIPFVLDIVTELKPRSILDIGIGTGKWGMLFREYLDTWNIDKPYADRKLVLIGVEAFTEYSNPVWEVYDKVITKDINKILENGRDDFMFNDIKLNSFDMVFMGDVIEHFEKEEAKQLLDKLNFKHIIIITPLEVLEQPAVYDNQFEIHRSEWKHQDLPNLEHKIIGTQQIFYG